MPRFLEGEPQRLLTDGRPELRFAWPHDAPAVAPMVPAPPSRNAQPREATVRASASWLATFPERWLLLSIGCAVAAPSFVWAAASLLVAIWQSTGPQFDGAAFRQDAVDLFFFLVCAVLVGVTTICCPMFFCFWVTERIAGRKVR
jgi:hypothetical protein